MSEPPRPYCRVYHEIVDDERFVTIFGDDHHLATWLRLLLVADQAWPSSAVIPMGTARASLGALVACGLIDLAPGHRFRLHGMTAERQGRSDRARNAAQSRWSTASGNANGTASGNAKTMLAEPSRAKPSQAEPDAGEETPAPMDGPMAYYEVTQRYPQPDTPLSDWCRSLASDYTPDAFRSALAEEFRENHDLKSLLSRTQDRLAMAVDQARRERPKPTRRAPPKVDQKAVNAELMKLYAVPVTEDKVTA